MSNRYKGGVISATPPTLVAGAGASGTWTLEQQMQATAAGLWPVNGPFYIEDVFSTYLYTGNGSTQTITNGIDLAGKGGLVWGKNRDGNWSHYLADTAQGTGKFLESNTTSATQLDSTSLTAFNANGFSIGNAGAFINNNGVNYASWTFRKQPKFFDVVTWTGDGVAGRQISHSLGSAPGAILVKNTNDTRDWAVWHNTLADGTYLKLNTTDAVITNTSFQVFGNASGQTSTYFTVGQSGSGVNGLTNASSATYVAYLFADDAGGFGLTGTDNVISCGSFTTDGSGYGSVTLGYEPQWILMKDTQSSTIYDNWYVIDNMRGFLANGNANELYANKSDAENANVQRAAPTATGFIPQGLNASKTYIYIAIRRGPMKVPTSGTSVFAPVINTGNDTAGTVLTAGFPVDLTVGTIRNQSGYTYSNFVDRLRGAFKNLWGGTDAAEFTDASGLTSYANQTGIVVGTGGGNSWSNQAPWLYVNWMFKRAPSFFDEVCYTGDGTADSRTFAHNLGVTPQLVMVKRRSSTSDWVVTFNTDHAVLLNSTNADTGYIGATGNYANGFLIGTNATTLTQYSGASGNSACNASGSTYVAYLFATCAGVSKVFSYTGNGSSQTINCGFTAGARWILIKRTDSAGDWYVWDSARGIVSGNDPHLSLNTSATEVTTDDTIDTDSTGFVVNQVSATNVNVSSATYIGIAIA